MSDSAFSLLERPDFRRVFLAGAVSKVGDAFQFVGLLWLAVAAGGPLAVLAVRCADTLPAVLFGLHGGGAADRWDRRRTMIVTDLVRAAALVPITALALFGTLPLWALVLAGFVAMTATSYFTPAFGALLPSLVSRDRLQQANGLVGGMNGTLLIAGWALAAGLLVFVSIGLLFALNALSFLVSAALVARVREQPPVVRTPRAARPRLRRGFTALRARPGLAVAVAMLAVGMSVMTGVWTIGVTELAYSTLGHGPSGLALIFGATAVGTIAATSVLTRRMVRRKVLASCLAWTVVLPGYLLLGLADSLTAALVGTLIVGAATGATTVLVTAACQESMPAEVLGRVMGVVFLAQVGSKAVGLLLIAPLYAVFEPSSIFAAGGVLLFVLAVAASLAVGSATRRARVAEAIG